MRLWVEFCISFYLLLVGVRTAAAPPPPASTPKPLTKLQERMLAMTQLELQVFRAMPSTSANRNRQLPLYEKLVELTCMPELHSKLEYAGDPQDSQCLEYLSSLERFQKDNLVAVCARHGIDSDACKTAYDDQYIGTFDIEKDSAEVVDLSAKLSALESEKPLADLESEIDSMEEKLKANHADADRKALSALYERSLLLACANTRIIVQTSKPSDSLKAAVALASPSPPSDHLSLLVEEFRGKRKETTPSTPTPLDMPAMEIDHERIPFQVKHTRSENEPPFAPVWRLRYLSKDCAKLIKRALNFDPQHARALCFQQGFSSPACIAALRVQRERARQEALLERQKQQQTSSPESRIGTF